MKTEFRARIGGKRFRVREGGPGLRHAEAYDEGHKILLPAYLKRLPQRTRVDVLLHEGIHLLAPTWPEKRVDRAATDLARLLETAGEI